jgi:hypothetical protein
VDEEIRRLIGADVSQGELQALIDWYTAQARLVAAFPAEDLKRVEPPLRSVPGPTHD